MRLYEFSKRCGISSKELLKKLKDAGFDIASHMSTLPDEARVFLEKEFNKIKKSGSSADKQRANIRKQMSATNVKKMPVDTSKTVSLKKDDARVPSSASELDKAAVIKKTSRPQVFILAPMSLVDFSGAVKIPVNDLIVTLLQWGILATKNQTLPEHIIERLSKHYGIPLEKSLQKAEPVIKKDISSEGKKETRLPVIVVLGHVDHGKTSLLDYVRKTRVTAKEKGGITQHLGAYEAKTAHGNIIFIDTPGHEAFSKIRERGAHLADIAILIVAADDSVKPQTIEAIRYAKQAKLPIIVAINKVDKVGPSQIEATKRDLSQHGLLAEEWGGDTICIPISAKTGEGVDQLLEMLTLQAELMELRTQATGAARGYVLESRLEKGRGPVGTILLYQGSIKVGDYFICGGKVGRVSSIVDSFGKKIKKVGPSNPVLIAGFNELPNPADLFKSIAKSRRHEEISAAEHAELPKYIPKGSINLIVKTDTVSSQEALVSAIHNLSKKTKKETGKAFNVVYSGIGDVSERDITLAANTGSYLLALHVKASPLDQKLAQKALVSISLFDIIYKLLEYLEEIALKEKQVKLVRKKIGEAIVRRVFDIKNVGVIAGCYVKEGLISRDGIIVAIRNGVKIGEGKIKSLQREKRDMKEVHAGYECAFMISGFNNWEVDDIVECFLEKPESITIRDK